MHKDLEKLILTKRQIAAKVKSAAAWLDKKFKDSVTPPLAISVLKGSVFFYCDVVRAMKTPVQVDFMAISSYGDSTKSSESPKIVMDISTPMQGRDVILIEDIIDSGHTIIKLKNLVLERGAKSFTVITLLNKPTRRAAPIDADYSCVEVGDEFIVGYGLDYAQQYRTLPYIGVLKREIYEQKH